jgi:hypothetical protein
MSVFKFLKKRSKKGGTQDVLGDRLGGLFHHVRFWQVRKSIKSSKSEALRPPINYLGCFGQKFERTVFERTTLSHYINRVFFLGYCAIEYAESATTSPDPFALGAIATGQVVSTHIRCL